MKITVLKPSKGRVTTTWLTPQELVNLVRSDKYSRQIGEFREIYPMMKGEKVELPRVNTELPALCFGAELERTDGNNFVSLHGYHPVVARENRLLLIEVSNLKDYREATLLRNAAADLPLTYIAFIGYDDRSLKIIVKFEAPDYDDNAAAWRDAFRSVSQFYAAQLHKMPDFIDPSPLQLCSLSHDPEAYLNEHATPFYQTLHSPYSPTVRRMMQRSDAQTEPHGKLLPGRNQEQTERMVFQFCLDKALDSHLMATDGEEAERMLCSLAVYCRESDIPLANAIRKTSYRPDLNTDMELVKRIFSSTYKRLAKRKGDPLRHVSRNSLLVWGTRHFIDTYYDLRMNILTHQAEFRRKDIPGDTFRTIEKEDQNSMTIHALAAGLKSWDRDLARYINSREIAHYNPIEDYLTQLPQWDGTDRISPLSARIPTDTPNFQPFFHTWLLGMVACWTGRDRNHGNALVPLLTGRQGTGKTSFCRILLPQELRPYYAENMNLKSETSVALAMSGRALINIDEFDKFTRSQHPLLKFLISQNDIDMRLPFASHLEMRRRFASFIATTNSDRPLVDATGSRRYLCVNVTGPIDFTTPVDYPQLYAQLLTELQEGHPFWLNDQQTAQLMEQNERFREVSGIQQMLASVIAPPDEQGEWMSLTEILKHLQERFPKYRPTGNFPREMGRALKTLHVETKHTYVGNLYKIRLNKNNFNKNE